MPKSRDLADKTRKALVKAMSTGSNKRVDKVIEFSNDDIPDYLRHLKELKKQTSKIFPITR